MIIRDIHVAGVMYPRYTNEIREWQSRWMEVRPHDLSMYRTYIEIYLNRVYLEQIKHNFEFTYSDIHASGRTK